MSSEEKLYWPIDKLYSWSKNPRRTTEEDFKRLKKQIQELGEFKPLIITPDGEVIGGNMRLRAYQELSFKKCWVSVVTPKNEQEKVKYALADNDRIGYYVEDELKDLVSQVNLEDLSTFSVDLDEPFNLEELFKEETKEEKEDKEVEPDEKEEPKAQLGDMFQLGRHYLICGDSLQPETYDRLLQGVRPDMIFADPPYNVGYNYEEYEDNKSTMEYQKFCTSWFQLVKPMSDFIVITPGTVNLGIWPSIEPWKTVAPWIKVNAVNSGSVSYLRTWEPIIFYGKPIQRRNNDVFQYLVNTERNIEHSCPKPTELMADIIQTFGNKVVLDIFGGSGATLIAAEKIGATCYMIELDPKYCDSIRKRYAKLKGQGEQWETVTPRV